MKVLGVAAWAVGAWAVGAASTCPDAPTVAEDLVRAVKDAEYTKCAKFALVVLEITKKCYDTPTAECFEKEIMDRKDDLRTAGESCLLGICKTHDFEQLLHMFMSCDKKLQDYLEEDIIDPICEQVQASSQICTFLKDEVKGICQNQKLICDTSVKTLFDQYASFFLQCTTVQAFEQAFKSMKRLRRQEEYDCPSKAQTLAAFFRLTTDSDVISSCGAAKADFDRTFGNCNSTQCYMEQALKLLHDQAAFEDAMSCQSAVCSDKGVVNLLPKIKSCDMTLREAADALCASPLYKADPVCEHFLQPMLSRCNNPLMQSVCESTVAEMYTVLPVCSGKLPVSDLGSVEEIALF